MRAVPALVQIATRCGSTAAPVETVCTYLPNLPWAGRVPFRVGVGGPSAQTDCLLTAQSAANSVLPWSQQLWKSPVVDHVFTLPPHRHILLTASLYSSTPVSLTSSVIDILRLFDPFPVVSPRDAMRDEIGPQ